MAPGGQEPHASCIEHDAGNRRVSVASNENVPLSGFDMPFEELLARELRKSNGNGSNLAAPALNPKTKKTFLKKGARGWWMRQPGVQQKVVKHTLASNEEIVAKTVPRIQSKQQHRSIQSPALSPKNISPIATSPVKVQNRANTLQNLSRPVSSIRTSCSNQTVDETHQLSLQRDNIGTLNNMSFISTNSTDILGMKNVRQSYEARQEREANEVAEFEAIERDLAAEKESYLMEKQQDKQPDEKWGQECHDNQLEDSQWDLAYSSFVSDLRGQEHVSERELFSYNHLDREGDLALEYEFHSASPKEDSMSERMGLLTHQHGRDPLDDGGRHGNQSSDLSAVSFDDSVPWDDCLSLQARHSVVNAAVTTDNPMSSNNPSKSNSNLTPFQRIKREVCFLEHDANDDNILRQNESSSAGCMSKDDAPVSSLVHHVFGEFEQGENSNCVSVSSVGDVGNTNAVCWASSSLSPPPPVQEQSLSTLKQKLRSKQKPPVARTSKNKSRNSGKQKEQARVKSGGASQPSAMQRSGARNDKQALSRIRAAQPTGAGTILPAVIEEKLLELEEEVKFYKSETLQLQKKRDHYDQEVKKLALERDEFARYQQEQRLLIEKEWERERIKMKREERFHERQWKLRMKATTSHHDRKDRGEVEMLKAQIVTMQIEEKARANKLKAANNNLRQRVSELEEKNRALSDEIKFLEKDRLEHWKKYEQLLEETQEASKPTAECRVDSAIPSADRNEMCTLDDVSAIKGAANELLQRWNCSIENTSFKSFDKKSCKQHSSSHHRVQLNSADGYNPKRYSLDQKDPRSSSVCTAENELDGESVKSLASNVDHVCDNEFYEWALPAADGDDADLHNTGKLDRHCRDREKGRAIASATSSQYKEVTKKVEHTGGRLEYLYSDGSKKIIFPDGNEKEIDVNGHVLIKFTNGDHKELFPDTGISVYYYHEAQTKLTTYPDHRKVYEFPNQQVETSLPDGTTEIQFADGIKKTIQPNGDEFSVFPDGTTLFEQPYGLREVTLLNQKKIRYLPDGQIVCVTPDGHETRVQSDSELVELMEGTVC